MAAQDYAAVVQQLYVAYFGRPADYFGLQNFQAQLDAIGAPKTITEVNAAVQANSNPALTALVNSFAASDESTKLYGTDNSPIGISKFLVAVFQNVIGRTPDLGPGWDFWYNALASGELSRADAALAIAEGALSNTSAQGLLDAQAVQNKQKVATAFTAALDTPEKINAYSTAAAVATATGLLKDVTASTDVAAYQTTVLAAVSTVVTGSVGGTTATLTTAVESVAGTNGNDTFNGTVTQGGATGDTLNALDSIDGGSGTDTLNILALDALTSLPGGLVVKNVENLSFRGAAGITFDQTAAANAGVTGVTNIAVTQATTATITAAATTAVSVTGATADITVNGGSSQSVTTAGGTGVDITLGNTTGAKGAISVTDSNQSTGNIAIDGGTTVSLAVSGAAAGTIDIGQNTKATGAISVTSIGAAADGATSPTLGAITIDGGSTVTVIQTATSDATAAAEDATGHTITQSAVDIGGGKATEVTVVQSAAATAVAAVEAIAAVKQTTVVTFAALAAGESTTIAGLTFTATKALTAAQVAAAFANIAAGATQGSAAAGNGIYTDAGAGLTAFSSGAVVASGTNYTVTFTEKTAGTNAAIDVDNGDVDPTTAAGVTGVAAQDAEAGVLGVVGGVVTINDDAGGKLTKVTLNGTGAATITSDKLVTLNVANTDANVTVVNTAATTLALTVDNLGVDATGTVALGATYTTLNLTAASDSAFLLTGAGVATLAVSGAGVADLSTSTLAALKTVTVSGSAGLTLDDATSATSVNTSATTGTTTIKIDGTKATYTGGAGKDVVTVSTATLTKAITLGAGDDTLDLTLFTNATLGANVSGGDGTDTLVLDSGIAATNSGNNTFATKFDGFEKLSLNQAAASLTVDLANLDNISYVISAGAAATFTETLTNFAANGTVELTTAKGDADSTVVVELADADGAADVLNVVLNNVATTDFGKLVVADVETINIKATDSKTDTIATHTLDLTAADAKAIVLTGNANVTLTGAAGNVALTSLDGSALTGKLVASTNGTVAETIKGGSAADTLTAAGTSDTLIGGAGADTLIVAGNLATLTGGAGNDTFNVAAATTNVNSYATITDLAAGDIIKFAASAVDFNASKVSLADTAVFQDYANAAVAATDTGDVSWFQVGGNTYVIDNVSNGTSFVNGSDIIVKITGLVDLSKSSFSETNHTLVVIS